MGVTIGVDAAKSGKNTHFLVIINVRSLQKIGPLNLTKRNRFKKNTARNNVCKVCTITAELI